MCNEEVVVYIVDDDQPVRRSFERLYKLAGFAVASFASAEDFLENCPIDARGCLLLDVQMPGLSGLDLQHELDAHNIFLPLVFITGKGDIPMTVKAHCSHIRDKLQVRSGAELAILAERAGIERISR